MKRGLHLLWLLTLASAASALRAAPVTDDSPAGMNCQYLAAFPRMAWSQPGGDWTDTAETHLGQRPYGRAKVQRQAKTQGLDIDASSLVRQWAQPTAWPGALMLRGELVGRGGTASLASREHPDLLLRPVLVLTWADGRTERLRPMADSHLGCPHYRSVGQAAELKLGPGGSAIMLFERPAGWGGVGLAGARLELWSTRQTGEGLSIALYAASLPGGAPGPVLQGFAAGYPGDAGLEGHPDVLLVERFEAAPRRIDWLEKDDLDHVQRIDSNRARADFEPLQGAALAVVVAQGSHRGTNSRIAMQPLAGAEPEELYFRYYLRFGSDWDPDRDGGKLPGFAGTYGRAGWGGRTVDGSNGWSARGSFAQQAPPSSALHAGRAVGSYVYHLRGSETYGETIGWNLGAGGWLQKGRWYSVEQHLRLNTPGRDDGVLRAWVDGRLVFERRDFLWRQTNALRIETVWMNIYHGGASPSPRDMTVFLDNLVIARKYIGPMAPAGPSLAPR